MRDLSAKAYGILMAIIQHNINISAESLSEHFSEGRRAMLSGLKELRDKGYLETKNQRVGNRIIKMSTITEKAHHLFFGVNSQFVKSQNSTSVSSNEQIKQNKTYSTVISKNMVPTKSEVDLDEEEFEVINMSGWGDIFSPTSAGDDYEQDKKAEKQKREQEFKDKKQKLSQSRAGRRNAVPKAEWSVRDVCYEFADRISSYWNIKPWQVTHSKFSGALGGARNRLGTNGEVELAAMEIFFSQITISEYKDAEVLWRLFVSRLPGLIGQASMSITTDQSKAVAKEAREIGRRKLRGENV